jgi:tetratricopeptide (TPR) repeat protein
MARYLRQRAEAQAAGFATPDSAEVVPFEAAPVQPVDPRLAWQEAIAVVSILQPAADTSTWQAPSDWATLVNSHEPAVALAFCLGNFPQLVRNLQPLLQGTLAAKLRPVVGRPLPVPALLSWVDEAAAQNDPARLLLAVAALRLARHFDRAAQLLQAHASNVPAEWKAAWTNEEAALAWHRGKAQEALRLWQQQPASVPVLFNRGMAALFLDQPAEARASLAKAVAQLPEDSAWHHLGRLYLALAEMRG